MQPKIILDTRKAIKEGKNAGRFHVKIKLSVHVWIQEVKTWKPKRAKTGVYVTRAEFKSMMSDRVPVALKAGREILDTAYTKARTIAKIPNLTPEQYIRYMEGKGNFESVVGMFDWYINECLKEDEETGEARDGNAITLKNARNFFVRYKGSEYISFAEVTPDWLKACKKWALREDKDEEGKVIKRKIVAASFYMYCRALRTVLNLAVDPFGKISKDSIPFGEGKSKYKIPSSNKKKRKVKLDLPLEKLQEQKNLILGHVSEWPQINKALNYWKASYFGNGANMADVLRWKIGDYDREKKLIIFERKKTENTEEDNEPIVVSVGPELEEIILKEGTRSLDPEDYIFPVLKKGLSSAERKQAVLDFIDFMNKRLKNAKKHMGLEIKLSSGSSRYLMSTILDRAGIPKSVIKDLLGHSSESTQSHYVSPYVMELQKTIHKILAVG
jgi:integrase